MINITLPDGTVKQFENPPSGLDVAKTISEGFARNCVAMKIDDTVLDLSLNIDTSSKVFFITPKDPEAIEILRHSAAHIMAQAVRNLYPEALLTIGPVVDDGFYYDIDMPPVSEDDFPKIEDEMKKIVKEKHEFSRKMIARADALKMFENDPYKTELIEGLDDGTISVYSQGSFTDLCRGPHIPDTGMLKAFKLMRVSGAYWRADQTKAQLQRIYGTAFFDKKELKNHLYLIEEAKKRDHRKIGAALDLFSFHDSAPGMPFFHAAGMSMWNALLDYWREEHALAGYSETKTPIMLDQFLWQKSGHWDNYRENMYTSEVDEQAYAIKPMNCPGGMILFADRQHSYRDLPIRAGEIGLVHRHELSGALSGLFRVRAFHQDDAHIFMAPDQIHNEILGVLKLVEKIYSTFGLTFHLELSTRPEKSIGTDEDWARATDGLASALNAYGQDYMINEGDGAFYGPKIDIHIKDALGRTWQCGTIQLDMSLPERFDLSYIDKNNEKKRPVMIHRVIYGSVERFFGILVEHYAGRFPLWFAPVQAIILPMNDSLSAYAQSVKLEFIQNGLKTEVDTRVETLKKKVRNAQMRQIPLIITLGEKEQASGTLSVRTLDGSVKYDVSHADFFEKTRQHIKNRENSSSPTY